MARSSRRARPRDLHEVANALPHVTVWGDETGPVYQVGGKSFLFFRTARPDAVDAATGERHADVVVVWVADEGEKRAMVEDPATPYFTTPHFDGHLSVLLRTSRVGELTRDEIAEVVQDAWLSRASAKRVRDWLASPESRRAPFVRPRE